MLTLLYKFGFIVYIYSHSISIIRMLGAVSLECTFNMIYIDVLQFIGRQGSGQCVRSNVGRTGTPVALGSTYTLPCIIALAIGCNASAYLTAF